MIQKLKFIHNQTIEMKLYLRYTKNIRFIYFKFYQCSTRHFTKRKRKKKRPA